MNKLEKKFEKLSAEDVLLALESESIHDETTMIIRPATEEEMQDARVRLGQGWVEKSIEDDKFEEQKQNYKTAVNPIKLRMSEHGKVLRKKMVEYEGTVYSIPDYKKGIVELFDGTGRFLQERPLRKEEIHGSNMEVV